MKYSKIRSWWTILFAVIVLAGSAAAQTACSVTYATTPQSSSAFGATLVINNLGTTAWSNWTVSWTYANGQTVSSGWNGVFSQSGSTVTVASESYNGTIAAGGSLTGVGFNGTWNGTTNTAPTSFSVNGTVCGGGGGSYTIAAAPTTLSVAVGSTATDAISVTDSGTFSGSVAFTASGLPTGVTAVFSPTSSATSSTVTFTAASTATAGTSTITVTGTNGSTTKTATIALTVTGSTPTKSVITSPTSGSTLASSTTFVWSTVSGAAGYKLILGTTSGASDIYNSYTTTATTKTVTIPTNGVTIYATLYTEIGSTWNTSSPYTATYKESGSSTPTKAAITSPTNNSTLTAGSATTFTWNAGVQVVAYKLILGTTALGSDIYNSYTTTALSKSVTLPTTSGTIYATLYSEIGTTWSYNQYTYTIGAAAKGFKLTASPTTLSVAQGASGTDTITVTDLSGFTGSVAFAVTSTLPTGVTASFSTTSSTTSSILTLKASTSAACATTNVTVTGTNSTASPTTATATIALTVTGCTTTFNAATAAADFTTLYGYYHDSSNGYFSSSTGLPYHSVETFMVEAPDYGHETVSETLSYYVWLEALNSYFTKDWSGLTTAWSVLESGTIPSASQQPTSSTAYKPSSPAGYIAEGDLPSDYPESGSGITAGSDPLYSQLIAAYTDPTIYGMHWIIDVDNWYGFGQDEDGTSKPSCMNTYQRGAMEGVFLTIPQPCWDAFKYGNSTSGYLSLFVAQNGTPAKQWKYTAAPDADARVAQAMWWADQWATAQGSTATSTVAPLLAKAAKLGDFLRYSFFDKYFQAQGSCSAGNCTAGTGYNSSSYLLDWYYAWGGNIPASSSDSSGAWAWRIGASTAHFGYQNPMAAYALSTDTNMTPKSSNGQADWKTSLTRQIEFYRWLQSSNGAIAGGATNSYDGQYKAYPSGTSTFYGMAYVSSPEYDNPPSNQWFGFQAWSMERVAEYYYASGDSKAKVVMDGWINWVEKNVTTSGTTYALPDTLEWTGQPSLNWNATTQDFTTALPTYNSTLTVKATTTTSDIGEAGALTRALLFYAAGVIKNAGAATTESTAAFTLAKTLLTDIWANNLDSATTGTKVRPYGISAAEARGDYANVLDPVYVPSSYTGTMPSGAAIDGSSTFIELRPEYKTDPDYDRVMKYAESCTITNTTPSTFTCDGTVPAPIFHYHRFWAQVDIASAYAYYAILFPNN